jgi:coenzyme F420-reducing hydrogenase alpha subunit
MSAVHAIDKVFGAEVTPEIRALRRLYYCGEWIESHSLHIHLLAARLPRLSDAIAMAKITPTGQAPTPAGIGQRHCQVFGGRPVNPVGCGRGFIGRRSQGDGRAAPAVPGSAAEAEELVRWTVSIKLPDMKRDGPFVSCVTRRSIR